MYYTTWKSQSTSISPVLGDKKVLKKTKKLGKLLNDKFFNLNWGGLDPLVVGLHVLLQLVIFMTEQKSRRKIFEWIIIYC